MIDYLVQNWPVIAFYGCCASSACALATLAKGCKLTATGWILVADWIAWNLTIGGFGYGRAPILLPTEDAMFLGFTIIVNRHSFTDPVVRMVAYLFLVAIVTWWTFIATNTQNGWSCYFTANVIFFLQTVVVGVGGARRYLAGRAPLDDLGRSLRPVGGLGSHPVHDVRKAPGAR